MHARFFYFISIAIINKNRGLFTWRVKQFICFSENSNEHVLIDTVCVVPLQVVLWEVYVAGDFYHSSSSSLGNMRYLINCEIFIIRSELGWNVGLVVNTLFCDLSVASKSLIGTWMYGYCPIFTWCWIWNWGLNYLIANISSQGNICSLNYLMTKQECWKHGNII